MEIIIFNGCKSKKKLKRLDMLKILISLKSIFYVEEEK